MRTRKIALGIVGALSLAVWTGCPSDEGPLEKAGRELDEAAEKAVDKAHELAGEGTMEKAGRKMDEAADEALGD